MCSQVVQNPSKSPFCTNGSLTPELNQHTDPLCSHLFHDVAPKPAISKHTNNLLGHWRQIQITFSGQNLVKLAATRVPKGNFWSISQAAFPPRLLLSLRVLALLTAPKEAAFKQQDTFLDAPVHLAKNTFFMFVQHGEAEPAAVGSAGQRICRFGLPHLWSD